MWGVRSLIEKTESHIVIRWFLFRLRFSCFLLGLLSCGGGGCCFDGESRWVRQESLDGISLREVDLGFDSNGNDVLESVDDAVGHGGLCAVSDIERHGGNVGNSELELRKELVISDVEDLWGEDCSVVVDVLDD